MDNNNNNFKNCNFCIYKKRFTECTLLFSSFKNMLVISLYL